MTNEGLGTTNKENFQMKSLKFKKLWVGIIILILLTPAGLILPEIFKSGGAWGEWGIDEIAEWMKREGLNEYVPEGLKRLSEIWSAPMPDYAFSGWEGVVSTSIAYIISGIIGVGLVVIVSILIGKFLARKDGNP